jgi:hypothetical protein
MHSGGVAQGLPLLHALIMFFGWTVQWCCSGGGGESTGGCDELVWMPEIY